MRKALVSAFLLFALVLPVSSAKAETLVITSSTFASSSVSSSIQAASEWLDAKFGVDLYEIANKVIAFVLLALKLSVNVLIEILPKIRDFLGNL